MSEPLTPPETPGMSNAEQPIAYQPVSGWAVAGCAAGGLFALLVAICTIVALSQGAPMFFPMWILALAVVGVILSLIGQRHVQNSDGTRAGGKLATVGLWLSLISGFGYFSYYYVTGLALENQANSFVMEKTDADSGFFPRLREAPENPTQLNAAFLLTRPATARSARPEDENAMRLAYDLAKADGTAGELAQFREHPFVRILSNESAKTAEITPLAVQEWHYEQRMYKVVRNYRIKTKELEYEFRVPVFSTEAEGAGQGRKWFVNLRDTHVVAKNLTEFGQGLGRLRYLARLKLNQWGARPDQGAFRDFAAKDQSAWDRLIPDPSQRKERRALVQQLGAGTERLPQFTVSGNTDDVGRWEEVDGSIRIYHGIRFSLPGDASRPSGYIVDGYAVLEPVPAISPEQFGETTRPPDWNLVRVVLTSVTPIGEKSAPRPKGGGKESPKK